MKNLSASLKSALKQFGGESEGIRFKDVRASRIIYVLAYALELIFYSYRGNFLPLNVNVFGLNGWTIVQVAHGIASLVIMLLWSARFKSLIYVSVAIFIAGFIPYVFLPDGIVRLIFCIIAYIGLGGAVTASRCGYAYCANNSERFFGILFMFLSVSVVYTLSALNLSGVFITYVVPLALMLGLCVCLCLFKEKDFEVKDEVSKGDSKGLYWAFAYFIVYFSIDGYQSALMGSSGASGNELYLILGMAIACVLLFMVFKVFKISSWHLWNFFFIFAIGMATFAVFAKDVGSANPQYVFTGLTLMGWPLCLYTMGCAQRKFASYKLLKRCTIIFVIVSPVTNFVSSILKTFSPSVLPVFTLCYVLAVTIFMLILSPFSYKYLFSSNWIPELYKNDMSLIKEKVEKTDEFEKYCLTPRQKEIATLLLLAKTRRQIAGELSISESTVKMHVTDLYRKLNINSRVELFRLFGVANDVGDDIGE